MSSVARDCDDVGLISLMFNSGSQVDRVPAHENRRETTWILDVGTPLPFFLVLLLGLSSNLPVDDSLVGSAGQRMSVLLILSIAVAVTSIPFISRIFYDLRILHTRAEASMLLYFIVGSSILALLAVGLDAKLVVFRTLDTVNIAVTTSARGGPGIVLASVAYGASGFAKR